MTGLAYNAPRSLRILGARTMAPAGVVGLLMTGLWLGFGVRPAQILLFAAYQLVFVFAPGFLAFRVLWDRPASLLMQIVFGWVLGHVLLVSAFMATGALGLPDALGAYPVVATGALLLLSRNRTTPRTEPAIPTSSRFSWALAAVCSVALIYVALTYFTQFPLPQGTASVSYGTDLMFHLGLVSEAKHHWPISDPRVSGADLPYHTVVHQHAAAISRITGIEVPVVLFRLYLPVLIGLVVAGIALSARIISRGWWVGPAAAGLFLLVGEIDLHGGGGNAFEMVFGNTIFFGLWTSPTFVMGLMFLAPTLYLVCQVVTGDSKVSSRTWALLGLFLFGCAASKAATLPVLVAGLMVFIGWQRLARGTWCRPALTAIAIAFGAFALSYLILFGGGASWFDFAPFEGLRRLPIVAEFEAELGRIPLVGAAARPLAIVLAVLGFCLAPLVGLLAALHVRRAQVSPQVVLLISFLAVGLGAFLCLNSHTWDQVWFAYYGYLGACLLSAAGLEVLWANWCEFRSADAVRLAMTFVIAWIAFLVMITVGPLDALAAEIREHSHGLFLALVGLSLAGLILAVVRSRRGLRHSLVLLAVGIVALGAFDAPLDVAPDLVTRKKDRGEAYVQEGPLLWGMTAELYSGFAWIRDHTSENAVLATHVQRLRGDRKSLPGYMYLSAFAERRVFLEGWLYAHESHRIGMSEVVLGRRLPYPERNALTDALYLRGDHRALRTMVNSYGVTHLVVDKTHLGRSSPVPGMGRPVFSNAAMSVYAVGKRQ